ncbi:hypothetical protein D9M68_510940 [compost metagenome]
MGLLQLQFGRVFDGDDAFVMRDETGQHIEHGGLAGAGTARDQHIQTPAHDRLEHQRDGRRQGTHLDQAFAAQEIDREATDRQARPVDGKGRDDGIDPRTILESRIHQGRGLVDASTQAGDDAIDDVQEVLVITKAHIGALQLAVALHEDRSMAVDQDVGHAVVRQ